MLEPVLMYGSGIWRTKSYNVINSVQNKACKYFYLLEKNTSNISTRGDMGWLSFVSKQRNSIVRLLCKLIRMDETRTVSKISWWASRRRKGWNHELNKTVEILNIQNEVNDLTFSTKFIMKTVKEKIDVRDQEEWYNELFNDRGNQNGNKLRTYRQFKQIRCTETYVSRLVHRPYRRAMALFCAGSLPLAIETGRFLFLLNLLFFLEIFNRFYFT